MLLSFKSENEMRNYGIVIDPSDSSMAQAIGHSRNHERGTTSAEVRDDAPNGPNKLQNGAARLDVEPNIKFDSLD